MCCVSCCIDFNWGVILLTIRLTVRPTTKTLKRGCWCLHICRSSSRKHHRNNIHWQSLTKLYQFKQQLPLIVCIY